MLAMPGVAERIAALERKAAPVSPKSIQLDAAAQETQATEHAAANCELADLRSEFPARLRLRFQAILKEVPLEFQAMLEAEAQAMLEAFRRHAQMLLEAQERFHAEMRFRVQQLHLEQLQAALQEAHRQNAALRSELKTEKSTHRATAAELRRAKDEIEKLKLNVRMRASAARELRASQSQAEANMKLTEQAAQLAADKAVAAKLHAENVARVARREMHRERKSKYDLVAQHQQDLRERTAAGTVLFHQTDPNTADIILQTQHMLPGTDGLAGGGIYFATTQQLTGHKAHRRGVILKASVRLGKIHTLEKNGDPSMSLAKLRTMGFDSVCIARAVQSGQEYVVYDPGRRRCSRLSALKLPVKT